MPSSRGTFRLNTRPRKTPAYKRARSFTVSSALEAGSSCFSCFFTQPRRVSGFRPSSRATSETVLLDLSAI